MHQQRPSGSKGVMSRHLRPSGGSSSNRTRSYVKRRFSYPKPSHLTQRDAADGKFGNRGRSFQKTFAERELRLTVVFCSVTTRTPKGGIKQCLSPEFVCKRITRRFPACAPLSTTSKRRNRSWGERQLGAKQPGCEHETTVFGSERRTHAGAEVASADARKFSTASLFRILFLHR